MAEPKSERKSAPFCKRSKTALLRSVHALTPWMGQSIKLSPGIAEPKSERESAPFL